jgi:hypothetical protein
VFGIVHRDRRDIGSALPSPAARGHKALRRSATARCSIRPAP